MALHAKPSGGYAEGSTEWTENITALWAFCLAQGYSEAAFAGMMGNAQYESGLNPWRWQSDTVSLSSPSKGYGLFQYTPAYNYINNYGRNLNYFAPNLSTSKVTDGAQAADGYCQILAIEASGKYGSNVSRTARLILWVADCANYTTISAFKTIDNVRDAAYVWQGYFEVGGWWWSQTDVEANMAGRVSTAAAIYESITGTKPDIGDIPYTKPTIPIAGGSNQYYGGIRDVIRRVILHA